MQLIESMMGQHLPLTITVSPPNLWLEFQIREPGSCSKCSTNSQFISDLFAFLFEKQTSSVV